MDLASLVRRIVTTIGAVFIAAALVYLVVRLISIS